MQQRDLSKARLDEARAPQADSGTRMNQKELEEWASTVAGCLHPAVAATHPLPVGSLASSETVAPGGWQSGVEVMTPSEIQASGAANRLAAPPRDSTGDVENRVQVRVKTDEYGEVAIVVERVDKGLRVLVGAEDARTVRALVQQSQAVRDALAQDGQTLENLEIVRMNPVGTQLAGSVHVANPRVRQLRKPEAQQQTGSERPKKPRRINLTG